MTILRLLAAAWLVTASTLAVALPDWLTPYPHAEQKEQRAGPVDDYLLALGTFKRFDGGWQPEQSLRISGELLSLTWRTPEGYRVDQAHRHWLDQFEPVRQRTLFSCRGRGCGSSHRWASELFRVRELAGSDGSQHYDVLELLSNGQNYVVALYSVQRGNQRVYTQLDLLALPDDQAQRLWITTDTLIDQLRHPQPVVLATFKSGDRVVTAIQLDALAAALRKDVRLRLELCGYAYPGEPGTEAAAGDATASLPERAKSYAMQVSAGLKARGIDPERITVTEAATTQPAPSGAIDRVELQRRDR